MSDFQTWEIVLFCACPVLFILADVAVYRLFEMLEGLAPLDQEIVRRSKRLADLRGVA